MGYIKFIHGYLTDTTEQRNFGNHLKSYMGC